MAKAKNNIEVVLAEREAEELELFPEEDEVQGEAIDEVQGIEREEPSTAGEEPSTTETETEKNLNSTDENVDEHSRRRKKRVMFILWLCVLPLVILAVAGGFILSATRKSEKSLSRVDGASDPIEDRVCEEGKIEDLHTVTIEMTLEGMTRTIDSSEQDIVELVTLAAYNEVSGGCGDKYERRMYQAKMVHQEIGEGDVLTADMETKISCYDCPINAAFASGVEDGRRHHRRASSKVIVNPTGATTTAATAEASTTGRNRVRGSRLLSFNALRVLTEDSTIDAMTVFQIINTNLEVARDNGEFASTFSGLSGRSFRESSGKGKGKGKSSSSKSKGSSSKGKGSSSKGKGSESKGKGKGSERCTESPSTSPSESNQPSTRLVPTSSMMPSESVSPTISSVPSLSNEPSTSLAPTSSMMPSESVSPTISSVPSLSNEPSTSLAPTSSMMPSESVSPTISSVPSLSNEPSFSLAPTSSMMPSESTSPTISSVPSFVPSGSSMPSESSQPSTSCMKPTSNLDVGVIGDGNIVSFSTQYSSNTCMFNLNNQEWFLQMVDWFDDGLMGDNCENLDREGAVLLDIGKSDFATDRPTAVGGAPPLDFVPRFQDLAAQLKTLLGLRTRTTIINDPDSVGGNYMTLDNYLPGFTVTVFGIDFFIRFKTVIIFVPDRINNNDVNGDPTNTPQYTCEEINALRDFIVEGGRVIFVGEREANVANGNDEINRILTALGSTLRLTEETTPNTLSSYVTTMSGVHDFTDIQYLEDYDTGNSFCTASGTGISVGAGVGGVPDEVVATYEGAGIMPAGSNAVAVGNIDRSLPDDACS